ncbi:MAG: hypothetical protein ACI9W2_003986 [Gammaproteobacteria bacterium]|jgi:hypothetical protein
MGLHAAQVVCICANGSTLGRGHEPRAEMFVLTFVLRQRVHRQRSAIRVQLHAGDSPARESLLLTRMHLTYEHRLSG